jgi:hypothetical protein
MSIILPWNFCSSQFYLNPVNTELNPIRHLLTLLAHLILHVSRIRVNQVEFLVGYGQDAYKIALRLLYKVLFSFN